MSGIYGTVKPANIDINKDVDIFYSYKEDRSYSSSTVFERLDPSNLLKATDGDMIPIDGLYNLKLPLSIFGNKGIYTIYIKPKEITVPIYAISTLQDFQDVRGVIFQSDDFDEEYRTENALTGYRIQYDDANANTENFTRIITSSNLCYVVPTAGANRFRLYENSGNSGSSNGKLIFCTVTPSTANGFTPTSTPSIGEAGQTVKVANTKFSPIMFEIEMVDHDAETLSYMLEGTQVRNLDKGTMTTYNHDKEIYKQHETYTVKTRLGKPLYDIKLAKTSVDTSQSYDNVIENEE